MGSLATAVGGPHYPDASDSSLILTHPTATEKEQTWRLNHGEWGGPLDQPAYMQREQTLAATSLTANGGMVHWILTDASPAQEQGKKRNVLASCETIRKRVLYVPPPSSQSQTTRGEGEGEVKEGLSYGIGSVYTYPEFRGRKYAARMLTDLGALLKTWPEEEEARRKRAVNGSGSGSQQQNGHTPPKSQEAVCSALWSDIGKRFYASKGWPAYTSEHVEFPSFPPSSSSQSPGLASLFEQLKRPHDASLTLRPVNASNLASLCAEDEAQLRRELAQHARETGHTAFAFAPEADVFRWHWAREEFLVSHVFPGRPASGVRGMVASVAQDQEQEGGKEGGKTTRMWAIWTRNYGADAAANAAKNTLYILRLVIDNNNSSTSSSAADTDQEALQLAFDAILHSALDAARAWNCGSVHLWNPTPVVQRLIAGCGLPHKSVDREVDSIPSMMWYGPEGEAEEGREAVDWLANEKYCWC
ncbi:hypothetical protein GGR51DRAFT_549859 [Nemania sp. FL0031]|nr:hypothetical protein GGR51DRAFT_549859 [Nemania sp. FL0031]